MSRNAPVVEDELIEGPSDYAPPRRRRVDRRVQQRRWDTIAVGVITPTVLVGTVVGVFLLGSIFYPDPNPPELVFPTPRSAARDQARPTPVVAVVAEPIDTAKLNAGIVDKPLVFDWPEVEDLKVVPNPGRPNEQADYTPRLAAVEVRREVDPLSVSIVQHNSPALAAAAAAELAKAYPAAAARPRVLDLTAQSGYLPDESGYGVIVVYGAYRIHIETVSSAPPINASQRPEVEYQALHLADHVARRVQEVSSSGRRTGPEATAVHWRDHLTRSLGLGG
jgi:hypothetical protein